MIYFLIKVSVLFAFAQKEKTLLAANNFVKKAYDDFCITTSRKRYTSTMIHLPSKKHNHFS